jgi:hypothetical protein
MADIYRRMVVVILVSIDQRCAPHSNSMGLDGTGQAKRLPWAGIWLAILALSMLAGCSRPAMQADARVNPHPVPFRDAGQGPSTAVSDSGGVSKSETGLPFQPVEDLPVGTLITVRLKDFISADRTSPDNTFEAVLDEPVKIDGNVVVPRGAVVAGHVQSAQISDIKQSRGNIRLELESIDIAGRELPVQTSTLFARGTAHLTFTNGGKSSTNVMTLERGRRLTFRLSEPVYMAAQRPIPPQ